MVIIADGRIVAEGAPRELGGRDTRAEIRFRLPAGVTPAELPVQAEIVDGRVIVKAERPLAQLNAITSWALERGHELPDLELERPTLEDVYLELTEAV